MTELNIIEPQEQQHAYPDDALWWHDGLLLEAAHFQQMGRRQEQLVSYHVRSAAPYNWGVRQLVVADRALTKGVFTVSHLEAIMPDGLVVSHHTGRGRLELPLPEELGQQLAAARQHATICLAVPVNEAIDADDAFARYVPVGAGAPASVHDGDVPIARIRPRMRLALASELDKQANDSVLPLARVAFKHNKFELLPFFPPLLDTAVAPPCLEGQSLQAESAALVNAMQRAASYLQDATAKRPADIDDQLRRLELRQRLASVTSGIPMLRGLLSMPAVAPLPLYLAWCGALGPLGALDDTGEVARSEFPEYRHDDLAWTFKNLFERVGTLLAMADRPFRELALKVNSDREYSHVFEAGNRYTWPVLAAAPEGDAGPRRDVLIIGIRGMTELEADQWLRKAVITASAEQLKYRMGRRMGAPRSAIKPDGKLSPFPPAPAGPEHKVDARGMATPDVCLYALDLDESLSLDADIVLQNAAARQPSEIVLFVHRDSK